MIADEACCERGCACHDPREGVGVFMIRAEPAQALLDKLIAMHPRSELYTELAPFMFNLRAELMISRNAK